MSLSLLVLVTLAGSITYASVFEWAFHRYPMHRPFLGIRYPFRAHALTHHQLFKYDHSYHLQPGIDKSKIPMAWWNGPALVLSNMIPISLVFLPLGFSGWWAGFLAVCITSFLVISAYYVAYEYLHWCMHLPKDRPLERAWFFRKLNAHHILHHRFMGTSNFNVVLPLADFIFGTLVLRSKIKFPQARGPVPDVQPLPT